MHSTDCHRLCSYAPSGWWYEYGAIRKSLLKSDKKFDFKSWLTNISCQASKKLFQTKNDGSQSVGSFSLDGIFTLGKECISQVLSVLDPTLSGTLSFLVSHDKIQSDFFNSELPLFEEHRSRLPDLICQVFQNFLSDLSAGAHCNAKNNLSIFTKSLSLISTKGKNSAAFREIDAMDSHGSWYQAFEISSNSKSSLIHFMVRIF
jgi:hypothetical protein